MIKSYGLPAIAVLLLAYAAPLAIAQTSGTTQAKAPQVQFVQVARNVTFKDGVLTLGDASPMTIFFSDRPERLTGQLRNDLFAKLWNEGKNGFKNDPPNAALVFGTEVGADVVILELTDPVYDPDAATLTYITKILDVEVLESSGYGFETDPLGPDAYPPEFGPASLFIDSLHGCRWDIRGKSCDDSGGGLESE